MKAVSIVDRDGSAPYTYRKILPDPVMQVNKFPDEIIPEKTSKKVDETKLASMAVCVKPFHYNFNRALWLVEFIEMYRLQGETFA